MGRSAGFLIGVCLAAGVEDAGAQVRGVPYLPESFQIRVMSAAAGTTLGVQLASQLPPPSSIHQYVTTMLAAGLTGAILGASAPRLDSQCSFVRRLGRGAVGGLIGLIPGTLLFYARDENPSLGVHGLLFANFGLTIGASAAANQRCPLRTPEEPKGTRGG